MPRYTFVARDVRGDRVCESFERPSLEAAVAELARRGWTHVELVSDNVLAGRVLRPDVPEPRPELDAWDRVALARVVRPWRKLLTQVAITYRQVGLLAVLLVGIGIWRHRDGSPLDLGDGAILALLLVPLALLLGSKGSRTRRAFHRYLAAITEARWQDALDQIPKLERMLDPSVTGMMRARCQAGLGHVEDAYRLAESLRPFDPAQLVPYLVRLGTLYGTAHDYDRQLANVEETLALAVDKTVCQLDLAFFLTLRRRDPARARVHLAASSGGRLPAWAEYFRHLVEGMIALEEGRLDAAEAELGAARKLHAPLLPTLPIYRASALLLQAYTALLAAARGDTPRARKLAEAPRAHFAAHRDAMLVARLDAATGALPRPA